MGPYLETGAHPEPSKPNELVKPLSPEQKARDLRDAVYSIAGALHTSEGVDDYTELVKGLLDQYPDQAVIQNLKQVVSKPLNLVQKFFTLIHETVRLGVNMSEMKKLAQAIAAY